MKLSRRRYSLLLVAVLFLATAIVASCTPLTEQPAISLSDAIALSKDNHIQKAVIDTGKGIMTITALVTGPPLTLTDTSGKQISVTNGTQLATNIDSLNVADLQALGFVLPDDYSTSAASSSGLSNVLLLIVPAILIFFFLLLLLRSGSGAQSQALNFRRSQARLSSMIDRPRITFADVAGADEAKQDLQEVVEFLKNRWRFQAIGATIPKGVLLVGPPGTGKTLLARAIAGEAGVPFFTVSGSEFVEIFVGVGAARVRDLFERAKRSAPSIVFIDEIDAVGRVRAGNIPGGHEEREQTLNQILTEMDGFDPNIGVIVLAATNRPDVLDPALLRPGRFDRRVTLDLPDTNGRLAILKLHAAGKVMDKEVDMAVIAKETHGFSGADLANLINEAAILAVRRDKSTIGMAELEESIDRVIAGPERRSLRINPKDKETTAYHEAGHALVAHMLPNVDPVHKISIVARGSMGGYTRLLTEDRYFITASTFQDTIATLLAGHAAEELMFHEASTGPHSDIKQATALARRMVTDYGMSQKLGLRTFGGEAGPGYLGVNYPESRDYGEEVAKKIDEEVYRITEEAHQIARKVLYENRPRLIHLAEKLLVKETIDGTELEMAFTEPLSAEDMQKAQGMPPPDKVKSLPLPQPAKSS